MPVKARALARALAAFGVVLSEPRSGSHWPAKRGGTTFPLPLHNGLKGEVLDVYVRRLCRVLDIDIAELKKKL